MFIRLNFGGFFFTILDWFVAQILAAQNEVCQPAEGWCQVCFSKPQCDWFEKCVYHHGFFPLLVC